MLIRHQGSETVISERGKGMTSNQLDVLAAAEALERCIASGCCAPELPPIVPPVVPKTDPVDPEGGTGDPRKEKEKDKLSAQFVSVAQAKPGPDARPKPPAPLSFADYYLAVPRVPREQVLSNARRALDIGRQRLAVNEHVVRGRELADVVCNRDGLAAKLERLGVESVREQRPVAPV